MKLLSSPLLLVPQGLLGLHLGKDPTNRCGTSNKLIIKLPLPSHVIKSIENDSYIEIIPIQLAWVCHIQGYKAINQYRENKKQDIKLKWSRMLQPGSSGSSYTACLT